MTKIDAVFYSLAVFSYFAIILYFKDLHYKFLKTEEIIKKKELYETRVKAAKEREEMERHAEERRQRIKSGMANTTELLSHISKS